MYKTSIEIMIDAQKIKIYKDLLNKKNIKTNKKEEKEIIKLLLKNHKKYKLTEIFDLLKPKHNPKLTNEYYLDFQDFKKKNIFLIKVLSKELKKQIKSKKIKKEILSNTVILTLVKTYDREMYNEEVLYLYIFIYFLNKSKIKNQNIEKTLKEKQIIMEIIKNIKTSNHDYKITKKLIEKEDSINETEKKILLKIIKKEKKNKKLFFNNNKI